MTKQMQIFKCELCGNMVEIVHAGGGQLICCGQNMAVYTENTRDAAREKHVPVVHTDAEGVKVSVGSVAHPMEEKHYIEWIEVVDGDTVYRRHLKPGQTPEASFQGLKDGVVARGYCNLHGLWKA